MAKKFKIGLDGLDVTILGTNDLKEVKIGQKTSDGQIITSVEKSGTGYKVRTDKSGSKSYTLVKIQTNK